MRIVPTTRVIGGCAFGLACFLGFALLLLGDPQASDVPPDGAIPTADEIEAAELGEDIGWAVGEIQRAAADPRDYRLLMDQFESLNAEAIERERELSARISRERNATLAVAEPDLSGLDPRERELVELGASIASTVREALESSDDPREVRENVDTTVAGLREAIRTERELASAVVEARAAGANAEDEPPAAPPATEAEALRREIGAKMALALAGIEDPRAFRIAVDDFVAENADLLQRERELSFADARQAAEQTEPEAPTDDSNE